MILFVFEGKKDKNVFEAMKQIFFPEKKDTIECVYECNLYSLYSKLKGYDVFADVNYSGDTVTVLKNILASKKENPLADVVSADVSEIYLFFDYDLHHTRSLGGDTRAHDLEANNREVEAMLDFFDNETETGKLYISYPMLEAIKYTKQLPDEKFLGYTLPVAHCSDFKRISAAFSAFNGFEHLCVPYNDTEDGEKRLYKHAIAKKNWYFLVEMNVLKANFICFDKVEMPSRKENISQITVFCSELKKYVNTPRAEVAVLSALPLFLYDYFPISTFSNEK